MSTHKNIRLLTWLNFCIDFRIYNAIAAIYFAQVTGSYALGLGIFSIRTISSSVFELPTGVLSDLVGRRMTVVLMQVSSVLSIICYAIGGSFFFLAIGAALGGLASALYSGNNSALLYDSLKEEGKEEHYSEYEGKTSSMFQIALAVSALIGSITLGFESFKFLFWLSVIPQVVGLVLAFKLVEPKQHYQVIDTNIFSHLKEALKKFKENARLRSLSFIKILEYGTGEAVHEFSPVFFATLWPAWAIALARVLSHLFGALGYRMSGKMIQKFGELRTLLSVKTASFSISTIIIAFPTILTPLIKTLTSFSFGISSVAQSSLLQKEFSDEQRATMGSLNSLAGSLFFGLGVFGLGLLADRIGVQYAMLIVQLSSVSVIILYWKLFKKYNVVSKTIAAL